MVPQYGFMSIKGMQVHMDAVARRTLEFVGERVALPIEECRSAGPAIISFNSISTNSEGTLGEWLLSLAQYPAEMVLARGITPAGLQVDALATVHTIKLQVNFQEQQRRLALHELNNRLNNLGVSSQLLQLRAGRAADSSVVEASEKFISEYGRLLELVKSDSVPAPELVPAYAFVEQLLVALPQQDSSPQQIELCIPDLCDPALLRFIDSVLQRTSKALSAPPQYILSRSSAAQLCYEFRGNAASDCAEVLQPLLSIGADNPLSCAMLDSAINAYHIAIDADSLKMQFCWRSKTFT